jgi:hypothetical protein
VRTPIGWARHDLFTKPIKHRNSRVGLIRPDKGVGSQSPHLRPQAVDRFPKQLPPHLLPKPVRQPVKTRQPRQGVGKPHQWAAARPGQRDDGDNRPGDAEMFGQVAAEEVGRELVQDQVGIPQPREVLRKGLGQLPIGASNDLHGLERILGHLPRHGRMEQGLGIPAQRVELQPGVCDHRGKKFKGGDADAVSGGLQSSAEWDEGLDIAARAQGEDGEVHIVFINPSKPYAENIPNGR